MKSWVPLWDCEPDCSETEVKLSTSFVGQHELLRESCAERLEQVCRLVFRPLVIHIHSASASVYSAPSEHLESTIL